MREEPQQSASLVHDAIRIYILLTYIQGVLVQVAKWGNSLAIRLPAAVVEALGLKEGD